MRDGTPPCPRCKKSASWASRVRQRGAIKTELQKVEHGKNPHCDTPPDSSPAGKRWHNRHGENACRRCALSNTNYERARKSKTRAGKLAEYADRRKVERPEHEFMYRKLELAARALAAYEKASPKVAAMELDDLDLRLFVTDPLARIEEALAEAERAFAGPAALGSGTT